MTIGRPTKYQKKYCKRLIELAKEGRTIEESCAEFGISHDCYYKWKRRHPEFDDADREALPHRVAYWIRIGRSGIASKGKFREKTWQFLMMNIARWGQRQIHDEMPVHEEETVDQLRDKLMEIAKRAKKTNG